MYGLWRTWKDLKGYESTCMDLEGLGRTWKDLEGHEMTWKDLKGIESTWRDIKGLGRTWKDLKGLGRTWKDLKFWGKSKSYIFSITNFLNAKCYLININVFNHQSWLLWTHSQTFLHIPLVQSTVCVCVCVCVCNFMSTHTLFRICPAIILYR